MNASTCSGPGGLDWVSVEACTLPTVERPLRSAEFDDLFATTLQSIERSGDTHVRLLLVGDGTLAGRVQHLADAESSCCSFFTFDVSSVGRGLVAFDMGVPSDHSGVLAGLVARAEAAHGRAS